MNLTVGSVFSGIGGFDEGFRRAGYKVLWQVETDKFCREVLRRRFRFCTKMCGRSAGITCDCAMCLDVPERYYLSRKAAQGILRRCEKQGRTLPTHLMAALEELAGRRIKRQLSPASKALQLEESQNADHNLANGCTTELVIRLIPSSNTLSLTCSMPTAEATDESTGNQRPLLVRRLTPIEVAGLPRGLDGKRYRALGNAVTVPVIEWLARRIQAVKNDSRAASGTDCSKGE